jgi:hypothetical protein
VIFLEAMKRISINADVGAYEELNKGRRGLYYAAENDLFSRCNVHYIK